MFFVTELLSQLHKMQTQLYSFGSQLFIVISEIVIFYYFLKFDTRQMEKHNGLEAMDIV